MYVCVYVCVYIYIHIYIILYYIYIIYIYKIMTDLHCCMAENNIIL